MKVIATLANSDTSFMLYNSQFLTYDIYLDRSIIMEFLCKLVTVTFIALLTIPLSISITHYNK